MVDEKWKIIDGYNSSTISKCCRNIKHTHKGYVWKYED